MGRHANHTFARLRPALIECNCKVDVPALRTVLWRILGNPNPTGVVEVAIDKDAPAIAFPAATSWQEASKKLVTGKASLAVR